VTNGRLQVTECYLATLQQREARILWLMQTTLADRVNLTLGEALNRNRRAQTCKAREVRRSDPRRKGDRP